MIKMAARIAIAKSVLPMIITIFFLFSLALEVSDSTKGIYSETRESPI